VRSANYLEEVGGQLEVAQAQVREIVDTVIGSLRLLMSAEEVDAIASELSPQLAAMCAPAKRPPVMRILIIEDNDDAAQMLQALLQTRAHDVETARNGQRGLELLRTRQFDCLICDLGLPEMSGFEVAQAIRSESAFDKLGLVALTGYGQADDRARSRDAGFDDHLTKPPSTSPPSSASWCES